MIENTTPIFVTRPTLATLLGAVSERELRRIITDAGFKGRQKFPLAPCLELARQRSQTNPPAQAACK